jgi:hypothetical protein
MFKEYLRKYFVNWQGEGDLSYLLNSCSTLQKRASKVSARILRHSPCQAYHTRVLPEASEWVKVGRPFLMPLRAPTCSPGGLVRLFGVQNDTSQPSVALRWHEL